MNNSVLLPILSLDRVIREDARSIIGNAAGGIDLSKDSTGVHAAEIMQSLRIPEQYLALLETVINIKLCDVELSCLSTLRRHYLKAIEAVREMNEELAKAKPEQLTMQKKALATYFEVKEADEEDMLAHKVEPTGGPGNYPFYRVKVSLPLDLPVFAGRSDSPAAVPDSGYGRLSFRASRNHRQAMSLRGSSVALSSAQGLDTKTGAGIQQVHETVVAP